MRVTVNGQAITSDLVEARQFDLIGKETIVQTVLTELRQLSRTPAVAADLKALLAAVVQEKPEAPRDEVMAIVQERSVAYTQTLAVRKVKPKLFAEVEQKAIDELVDEQLMLQEAQREGVDQPTRRWSTRRSKRCRGARGRRRGSAQAARCLGQACAAERAGANQGAACVEGRASEAAGRR